MLSVYFLGRNLFGPSPLLSRRPHESQLTRCALPLSLKLFALTATVTAPAAAAAAADTVQHIPKALAVLDLSSGGASLCAIGLKDLIIASGLHRDTT